LSSQDNFFDIDYVKIFFRHLSHGVNSHIIRSPPNHVSNSLYDSGRHMEILSEFSEFWTYGILQEKFS
jgi:hypothetical protein